MKIREGAEVYWEKWIANNQDDYGKAIVRGAEKIADTIEGMLNNPSAELESVAELALNATCSEYDLTGYMVFGACCVLASVWEHGEEYRKWHNAHFLTSEKDKEFLEKINGDEVWVYNPSTFQARRVVNAPVKK